MLGFIAVADWWKDWADVAQVIGVILAAAALVIASWQLRKAAKAARGQFLLAIDDALAGHSSMRSNVYKTDWEIPNKASERNAVRRYIAVFERLGILLRDRNVSIQHVDQIYGDRIAKITTNKSVRCLIEDKPAAWRDFVYLWQRLYKRRKRSTRLKPHDPSNARKGMRHKDPSTTCVKATEDRFEPES